jgi:hypothetical protein
MALHTGEEKGYKPRTPNFRIVYKFPIPGGQWYDNWPEEVIASSAEEAMLQASREVLRVEAIPAAQNRNRA